MNNAYVAASQGAGIAAEGSFVHDGIVMNIDRHEENSSAARMTALKSEIGDEPLVGIEHRPGYRFAKRFSIFFSAFLSSLPSACCMQSSQ
ncbi:MAG: hypothetical protein ACI364_03325 [Coriobacteriales bacterium]